jgi:rRNA-processing protein FCF1
MASNRLWKNRNLKVVILDTSAIFMCFEFSINLNDEITKLIGKSFITIPKPIYNEIKILSIKGKEKKKKIAKASLKLIKNKYEIIDINNDKIGDNAILQYAKNLNGIVVTNDKELRKKLKNESIPVIYLRGKQKLFLE